MSGRLPVSAPRITHSGKPSAAAMSTGPSSGSMLQKLLMFTPCMTYIPTASMFATVLPYQKLLSWGRRARWSNSRYRAGFFVRNK